jgi:hypothetical protein
MEKTPKPLIIDVSLNLEGDNPYLELNLPHPKARGAQEIIWKIAEDSPIQAFRFFRESVRFTTHAACFIYPEAHAHERSFRIYNTHTIKEACSYTLMVEFEGRYFITPPPYDVKAKGDPVIHNQ